MSYSESEHQGIFETINFISNKYKIPVDVLFEVAFELLKRIPHYPGLVNSMLQDVVKKVNIGELQEGDFVVLEVSNGIIFGEVVDKKLKIYGKKLLKYIDEVDLSSVVSIYKIEKKILEKKWPTLVFKR